MPINPVGRRAFEVAIASNVSTLKPIPLVARWASTRSSACPAVSDVAYTAPMTAPALVPAT
jgi:hypothetical protein